MDCPPHHTITQQPHLQFVQQKYRIPPFLRGEMTCLIRHTNRLSVAVLRSRRFRCADGITGCVRSYPTTGKTTLTPSLLHTLNWSLKMKWFIFFFFFLLICCMDFFNLLFRTCRAEYVCFVFYVNVSESASASKVQM